MSSKAGLVSSRMQSSRRRTTKGGTTLPYSDCLKSPRRVSAIDQTNALRVLISLLVQVRLIAIRRRTLGDAADAVNAGLMVCMNASGGNPSMGSMGCASQVEIG